MTQHEQQTDAVFTRQGAILGFVAYLVVALLIFYVFMVG